MQYRREIDGLRAIAVVPVVLFHAGFSWFRGGYVGVDVFFVISGYLITSLIFLEQQAGRFSLIGFYERRARRILPALFTVIAVCLPLAWLWMPPGQLVHFGESVGAVSLFVSNILFGRESGYFDAVSLNKPLLHTWSLAVEEQYYLVFPLFVMTFWRLGKARVAALIAIVATLSFLYAHIVGHSGDLWSGSFPFVNLSNGLYATKSGFFIAGARAWEIFIGAMVAAFLPSQPRYYGLISEVGAAVGFAAIAYSVLSFTDLSTVPCYPALIPTLGAALIIIFATPSTLVGKLLCLPMAVGIGLISYSLYLWHQPLFALARIHDSAHFSSPVALGGLGILSAGLAYCSWRWIEVPFRNRKWIGRARVFEFAAAGAAFFIAASAIIVSTQGGIFRYVPQDRYLAGLDSVKLGKYVETKFLELQRPFSDTNRKKVLVLGDSFAEDFINMQYEAGALSDYETRTFYVPAVCQIVLPSPPLWNCKHSDLLKSPLFKQLIGRANIVIVAASWEDRAARELAHTLVAVGLKPDQRLFVIGAKRFGPIRAQDYLGMTPAQRSAIRNPVVPDAANDLLKAEFPPTVYVDVQRLLCGPRPDCALFTPDGQLITFDGFHLTEAGAQYAGHLLFTKSILRALGPDNQS